MENVKKDRSEGWGSWSRLKGYFQMNNKLKFSCYIPDETGEQIHIGFE